jgi:hypothetical protein
MRENKDHLHWPSFAGKYVVAVHRLALWVARQQDPILLNYFGVITENFFVNPSLFSSATALLIYSSHS